MDEPKRPKSQGAIPVISPTESPSRPAMGKVWQTTERGFILSNELGNPMNLEALAVDVI